jgi:hypothetical protein
MGAKLKELAVFGYSAYCALHIADTATSTANTKKITAIIVICVILGLLIFALAAYIIWRKVIKNHGMFFFL